VRRGWAASAMVVALALSGCGDDDDRGGSSEPEQRGLDADAEALVDCLDAASVDAGVNDSVPLGVDDDVVGVEAKDLPSEVLKFDSGSGTLTGVDLWIFETGGTAEEARTAITLDTEDGDARWVDGRVVVRWFYPVDRTQQQAVAVDDCVAELNAS
jgi:hypothetical protein